MPIKDHVITVTLENAIFHLIYHILTDVLTMDSYIYIGVHVLTLQNKNLHFVTLRAYVFVLRFMSNKA